ncbi:2 [Podarcis lilfordi]|uniref:2 n=1 Tax=Podarcis lilfordi TaxID=74358 RepID=A0AA35P5U5_9SAUR|nr:2 [Podarcis lilfordi] [Podarcis lilfordi]
MGDTAPPQAPGLLGGGGGSVAAPRVHSAIVERLRARIAICRQHHLSCEGRYERGRAESSSRERESTLQLLNLVQHGQAARKGGKHSKAAAANGHSGGGGSIAASAPSANAAAPPPADYYRQQLISNGTTGGRSGINGEQPGSASGAEQRNPALIAFTQVQHSCSRGFALVPAHANGSAEVPESSTWTRSKKRIIRQRGGFRCNIACNAPDAGASMIKVSY